MDPKQPPQQFTEEELAQMEAFWRGMLGGGAAQGGRERATRRARRPLDPNSVAREGEYYPSDIYEEAEARARANPPPDDFWANAARNPQPYDERQSPNYRPPRFPGRYR